LQVVPTIPANPADFPFIAHLVMTFPVAGGGIRRAVGSGSLISSRMILTAGHNIFDPLLTNSQNGYAGNWIVTLGGAAGIQLAASNRVTTKQWIETDAFSGQRALSSFDFGVLVLPTPVTNIAPLPFDVMPTGTMESTALSAAGYLASSFPQIHLVGNNCLPSTVQDTRCFYPIATKPGMSGGPVYDAVTGADGGKRRTIRAIHTSFFDRPGTVNDRGSGLRITGAMANLIRRWLQSF
jgi:V8-like Glu-specific endopeptidase